MLYDAFYSCTGELSLSASRLAYASGEAVVSGVSVTQFATVAMEGRFKRAIVDHMRAFAPPTVVAPNASDVDILRVSSDVDGSWVTCTLQVRVLL